MRKAPVLVVLLVPLALLACDSSPSRPDAAIPFTTLMASQVSGSAGPQIQTVVRSQAAWIQVWSDLWGAREIAPPQVDFTRDMVVLATASETCAGAVEIEAIEHTGNALRIRYGDAAPSLCVCIQPQLFFHAVLAPRVLCEAHFEVRQTPPVCG